MTSRGGDADLREFAASLMAFDTTAGRERALVDWLAERLDSWGFETYRWTADARELASHPSFPDDPVEIDVTDRPSVGGVLEFGDPDAGPTIVLNGHVDVVPAETELWSSPPFGATWDGDELTARGAADMKSGLAACVFAARQLAANPPQGDGRVVVEGVAGEEEGGIGAASAALSNPYPFERDTCIIAEPTELRPIVASEGSLMKRLRIEGRSAHAATPWHGEDVLDHFDAIRGAFNDLAAEREERVTHELYEDFPTKWPVVCGTVDAGTWASTVPDVHTSEWRIGVAPGETVAEVEAEFDRRLDDVVVESEWLTDHPPEFERFSIQFEASEIDADEPIVQAVQAAMRERGLPAENSEPEGATYGADARHYIDAGIPTVLFGPGSIAQAHFPDETVDFREVETATDVIGHAVRAYLG